MSEGKRYTIEDLVEKTGFSRRTIRYYVQEGLLDPPAGRGRGGFYFDSHLQRLMHIRRLQAQGLKLAAIAGIVLGRGQPESAVVAAPSTVDLPAPDTWEHYTLAPGVDLSVRHGLEAEMRGKIDRIMRAARAILNEEEKHDW